jgi:hypothetical protein
MQQIKLNNDSFVLVDDENYQELNKYNWSIFKGRHTNYAQRSILLKDGKRKTLLMHRVILGINDKRIVDHWDDNGLNNQKENLKISNNADNIRRQKSRSKSGFKGVYFNNQRNKWVAQIYDGLKIRHLGIFVTSELAAKEYDKEAIKLFGDLATLNFKGNI